MGVAMSVNYASRLSEYRDKGVCGVPEVYDAWEEVERKVSLLCEWLGSSSHAVAHTGAGISTSAGIPDFRGPKGVWTLEKKGEKLDVDVHFEDALPTLTHLSLTKLVEKDIIKYIVSQNVDGLHLKSGLDREHLSELHGNMFVEKCEKCSKEYVHDKVVPTIGLKYTGNRCTGGGARGRCRGKLRDTVLDWEDDLPADDLSRAELHSTQSDLSLCLGTTLQILPSGKLPLRVKKNNGKLVICNLQPTQYDKKADLVIHYYVDDVMNCLMKKLNLTLAPYPPSTEEVKRAIDV